MVVKKLDGDDTYANLQEPKRWEAEASEGLQFPLPQPIRFLQRNSLPNPLIDFKEPAVKRGSYF